MQKGYFGNSGHFGGRYVPEAVMNQLFELECEADLIETDHCFWDSFERYMTDCAGGKSPLYLAERLSEQVGHKIYLKRADFNDAASLGPALGQMLMWKRIGYRKVLADAGTGLWGLAAAKAAALLEMECTIYIEETVLAFCPGVVEVMERCGAGTIVKKEDSYLSALLYWSDHSKDTAMIMTGEWGPFPYPDIAVSLQKTLGQEWKDQLNEREGEKTAVVTAGLRTENVLSGLFAPFFETPYASLYAAEPEMEEGTACRRQTGIGGGMRTPGCLNRNGEFCFSHTEDRPVPVLGPALADSLEQGRMHLKAVSRPDWEKAGALAARTEGIILDCYNSCALAVALNQAKDLETDGYAAVFFNREGGLL